MFDEARKSINSILYERMTSPLYGTLIITWLIWNWKIVYLTLFVSEDQIEGDKITYIVHHYCDLWTLIYWPLISTVAIIVLIPFISNGAYWLTLKFNLWRHDQKIKIENNQVLSIEQSIELRTEMANMEARFKESLNSKDEQVKSLLAQISQLNEEAKQLQMEKNRLRILKATYGTNEKFTEVTTQLQGLVKDNRLKVTASNSIAGDPHERVKKKLTVIYELNSKVIETSVIEGDILRIE